MNQFNPLISVILPVYNCQEFVFESINSVLNQTYSNFELIIINDGSNDLSHNIITKIFDPRIRYFSQENKGLIYCLNFGISISKGDFIARMDADDICLPSRLKDQLEYIQEKSIDVCGSWINVFSHKTNKVVKYPDIHNDILFRSFFISGFAHPSVIFKKEVFNNINYESYIAEDHKLWCSIIKAGYKTGNVPKVLLNYRSHPNQITKIDSVSLRQSSNDIGLEFSIKFGFETLEMVNLFVEIQNHNNFSKFIKAYKVVDYIGKSFDISSENRNYIFKLIYQNASPKNPLIYFYFFSKTKEDRRISIEEFYLFVNSFFILSRNSYLFSRLKNLFIKIKNITRFLS
jgi:glycosyltransferase involved in cell wall biosynthesis